MRTFIAVPISPTEGVQLALIRLLAMRPSLKMISLDQLHVTVAFLGETEPSLISDLSEIIRDVARSEPLGELTVQGLGTFPNSTRPTVVWAGFADPLPLVQLADRLGSKCEAIGFVRESRPFQPHLTLARVKLPPPVGLAEYISEQSTRDFGNVTPSMLTLFRSDLGSSGPTYTSLYSANFMAASSDSP